MKPDYKNWMPKGMVWTAFAATAVFLILFIVFGVSGLLKPGVLKTVLFIVFQLGTVSGAFVSVWMILMYRAFSYNGKRQMSRQIIEGTASYVTLPEGGKCLDVGCGSGALAIAVAKRNPKAEITGIDRWGKEYASFSRMLCENNAKTEGVSNAVFMSGNAVKLDFADETFDAVVSNYVYHNIPGDRQEYLLETLRTLKKGGTFALHDIFSKSKYGDMQAFIKKLRDMGYAKVRLIDTTNGMFMSRSESKWMALSGSALLTGKK
ncbi:MAG: class I SAM-dependent methyltransferase [Clostridiales bacterium]|nr:class I SAM-dependent methyltransferase [Clostridiales bacterium]